MKCDRCLGTGTVFEGEAVASSCTLLSMRIFRDEHGKHHRHDPNLTVTTYRCPVGHTWKETESRPCWCGWRIASV